MLRLEEGDGEVVAPCGRQLVLEQRFHRIEEMLRHQQDAHGSGDAGDREQPAQRKAGQMANDHQARLVEPEPGEPGEAAIARRHRWPHRLGGCQPAGRPDRSGRAQQRRRQGHHDHGQDRPGLDHQLEQGKAEELRVEPGERTRQPDPAREPDQDPGQAHHQHQLDVVQPDLGVGVAEGLQHTDRLALHGDQPAGHRVQEKDRDRQEDHRQEPGDDPQLLDLLRQEIVRELVGPGIGALAAVRVEQAVQGLDHRARLDAPQEGQRQLVEGAIQIEGGGQRRPSAARRRRSAGRPGPARPAPAHRRIPARGPCR